MKLNVISVIVNSEKYQAPAQDVFNQLDGVI